jgi:hypothetical protein
MNQRMGTFVLAALVLSVLLNPTAANRPQNPTSSAKALDQSSAKRSLHTRPPANSCIPPLLSLCDTIADFFGNKWTNDTEIMSHLGVARDDRGKIEYVIALVPDPVHTHLSLFFDRSIEAIQQGAQRHNYIFARATLPWDDQQHVESTDYTLREGQKEFERTKGASPGLMIFRKAEMPDSKPYLFIFVVGETPTAGIHKDQFQNALKAMRQISNDGSLVAKIPLAILGPTFSGSLYSLEEVLEDKRSPNLKSSELLVFSGTVSSSMAVDWFNGKREHKMPQLLFKTFQAGDQYALSQFVCYVTKTGYEAHDVAVLSESETAYGSSLSLASSSSVQASVPQGQNCRDPTSHCGSEKKPPGDLPCVRDWDIERKELIRLYFPRDISQLRSAYQQSLLLTEAGSDKRVAPPLTLPLNLEDTGSEEDSVATFAHRQTPLSQEAVLLGIVTSLKKHAAKFVVIQASNPLDQLFLSRFFRKVYAGVRIVTIGADLLFQREKEDASLRGILALTPYSLLPGADDYAAKSTNFSNLEHTDLVFPSSLSVGIFNATVSLLTCRDLFRKEVVNLPNGKSNQPACPADFFEAPDAPYVEFGWPQYLGDNLDPAATRITPPLWLTGLGRDGYWGLALLSGKAFARSNLTMKSNVPTVVGTTYSAGIAHPPHVTQDWELLAFVMVGLAILFLLCCWFGSANSSSETLSGFAIVRDPHRTHMLVVAALLILVGLCVLIWPWYWFDCFSSPLAFWGLLGSSLAFVALFATNLHRRKDSAGLGIFLICFLVIALVSLWVARRPEEQRNYLLLYRSYHFLSSGVSPLLPCYLLLAAGLWWAWYSLSGLALLDGRRPLLPLNGCFRLAGQDDNFAPHDLSDEGNRNLVNLLKSTFATRWVLLRIGLAPLLSVLACLWTVTFSHPLESVEGQWFDMSYGFFFSIVAYTLLCDTLRMLVGWWQFRHLLQALERLPLRRGFDQVKRSLIGIAWRPGADIYRALFRERESLIRYFNFRGLVNAASQQVEETAEAQVILKLNDQGWRKFEKQTAEHFYTKRGIGTTSDSRSTLPIMEAHKLIRETCCTVLQWLDSQWERELEQEKRIDICRYPLAGNSESEQPNMPPDVRSAETFVCFVYLAFIQRVMNRMRLLAFTIGGMYVLLLLSISSYPFEPHSGIRAVLAVLLVAILGVVSFVFARMNRDATLSRISNTKPGDLGLDFWLRLAGFTALPLISFIGSLFPELGGFLFSWLPAINAGR